MLLIHQILVNTVKKMPDKEAFVCKNKRYTYRDIFEASQKVADLLISRGIKKGDRIGIFSTKSIEEVVAIFAILQVGAIFVHINPYFKQEQFAHIIADCNINVLFFHGTKWDTFQKAFPGEHPFDLLIHFSSDNQQHYNNSYSYNEILMSRKRKDRDYHQQSVVPDQIAAIIYTSGSTGMPKGVIVTHQIFYDSTVISARVLENRESDRIISMTPFSFDGALSQLFTSVLTGATLILQCSNFPKDIVNTMLKEKITCFHGVPSFWRMLTQRYSPLAKHEYPHLRYISIIGEAFPEPELLKLKAILKDTIFYMMYGTTEAFRSTYLDPVDFNSKRLTVGRPFPGVEISIVNERGKPCKPHEVGEIVHKGVFISPGYWNDPVNSARVFKDGGVYTGDLGKVDEEGYLYYICRKDGMIKVRGFRVSPEEVESCFYKLKGVSDACIVGIVTEDGETKIKALLSLLEGYSYSEKELLNHCKRSLPVFMLPDLIEFQKEMPRTGTFKINRAQLSGLI